MRKVRISFDDRSPIRDAVLAVSRLEEQVNSIGELNALAKRNDDRNALQRPA